jgi:hypothetical protein
LKEEKRRLERVSQELARENRFKEEQEFDI